MSTRRMNRRTFAATYLLGFVGANAVLALSSIADATKGTLHDTIQSVFGVIILGVALYLLITWMNATINRLQDIGWHWPLAFVFFALTPALLILNFIPGQKYDNAYGPAPAPEFDLKNAFRWW